MSDQNNNQLAVCLIDFLAFLGAPFLKQLQKLISAAIVQLQILEGQLLQQEEFTKGAATLINEAVGVAELVTSEVQNILGAMPLGVFNDCAPAATMVSTLQYSFSNVLNYLDEAENQANKIRTMADLQGATSTLIDQQITYLQNLNQQIGIIIIGLAKGQTVQQIVG
jgi:hypothetical protein